MPIYRNYATTPRDSGDDPSPVLGQPTSGVNAGTPYWDATTQTWKIAGGDSGSGGSGGNGGGGAVPTSWWSKLGHLFGLGGGSGGMDLGGWAGLAGQLIGLFSNRQNSSAQNRALDLQGQLVQLQRDQANELSGWGRPLMRQGAAALQSLLPFYTRAAYGDRSVLQDLIRPELRGIAASYDRPLATLTEVAPRTSATTADRMRILAGRGEAMSDAIYRTRMNGMSGLAGIGGTLMDTGRGAVGAALGGLSGASTGNLGMLTQMYGIRNQNNQDNNALGASIVDFLKWYSTQRNGSTVPAGTTPTNAGGGSPGGWSGGVGPYGTAGVM